MELIILQGVQNTYYKVRIAGVKPYEEEEKNEWMNKLYIYLSICLCTSKTREEKKKTKEIGNLLSTTWDSNI